MTPTRPDPKTRDAERHDADTPAGADRPPTEDEARRAEAEGPVDDTVIEHAEEMAERGANQQGEGRIA